MKSHVDEEPRIMRARRSCARTIRSHARVSTSLAVSGDLTAERFVDAESTQFLDETLTRDPEDARRATLVSCGESQHLADVVGLHLRERGERKLVVALGRRRASRDLGRQMIDLEALALLEQRDALDEVPQ